MYQSVRARSANPALNVCAGVSQNTYQARRQVFLKCPKLAKEDIKHLNVLPGFVALGWAGRRAGPAGDAAPAVASPYGPP